MKCDDLTPIWGNVAVIVTHRYDQQFVLHARRAWVSPIGPTEQQLVITALVDAATIAVILDIKEARLPVGVACGTMFTTETAALTKISVSGRRDTSDVDVMLEFREIRMAKVPGACAPSGVFVPIAITEQTVGVRRPTLEQMYPITAKPLGVLRDPMASHDEKLRAHEWLTEYGFGGYLRPIDDPRHGQARYRCESGASHPFGTGGSVGGSSTRGGNASSSYIPEEFRRPTLDGFRFQCMARGEANVRTELLALPGVTSAVLHDCSTVALMRPDEVAVVVDGGDPEMIKRVLRDSTVAGIVTLGTEGAGVYERWYTPATARELYDLLWLRKIASQGPTIGPLDETIDGVSLHELLDKDSRARQEVLRPLPFTPAQRAAVSAYWSAQLRAKVAASAKADAERERNRVVIEHDVDDEPWGTW